MSSHIPAVVEKHLDAIQLWEDGKVLLASSNLTGRYWNGSIFCFTNIEDAPNIEKCIAGIETESGIGDMRCLTGNKVVVGMDSGAVELYELINSSIPHFDVLSNSCEHDDIVSSLSINCNESKLVSSGYDKSIKVWDLESCTCIATYRPVHSGIVWQVSCSTTDPELLVSCGQDGKILLLDLRLPKPAIVISPGLLQNAPSAVAWKPQSDTLFSVGDESGCIAMRDIRNPEIATHYAGHKRGIYRLSFSPTNSNWLASCADDTDVLVTDVGKGCPSTEYRNDSHSDFVRGLAWSGDNTLITCGWDKQVFKHIINTVEMDVASGSVCSSDNAVVNSV